MFQQTIQIERAWDNLVLLITLSADDVLQQSVYRGEDVYHVAEYLGRRFPGMLSEWEGQCLQIAEKLLVDVVDSKEITDMLGDFTQYKDMAQQDVRDRICDVFAPKINLRSPDYLKSALIAIIEYGLGNTRAGVNRVEFALCEKADPQFPHLLFSERPSEKQEVKDLLVAASRQTAELLVVLIKKYRTVPTLSTPST